MHTKKQDQITNRNTGNVKTIKDIFKILKEKLVKITIQVYRQDRHISGYTVARNVVPIHFIENPEDFRYNPREQQRKPQKKQACHQHVTHFTLTLKKELQRTMGITGTFDHVEKNSKI